MHALFRFALPAALLVAATTAPTAAEAATPEPWASMPMGDQISWLLQYNLALASGSWARVWAIVNAFAEEMGLSYLEAKAALEAAAPDFFVNGNLPHLMININVPDAVLKPGWDHAPPDLALNIDFGGGDGYEGGGTDVYQVEVDCPELEENDPSVECDDSEVSMTTFVEPVVDLDGADWCVISTDRAAYFIDVSCDQVINSNEPVPVTGIIYPTE
jgi:hypothetical protein